MEVAGQWRREWAGAAEYGKVTEGGVTRRVARALEVLQASAPGARMRVVRAAWHASAGPGAPASSYVMHSSRQVISSGSRLLSSPSFKLSKPLEISSTPLEIPHDDTDIENYKVTEPDDFDISEPSKWKSSTAKSSFRMPSEESSSTDNASIIELDSRNSTLRKSNSLRRHSYDSENSDIQQTSTRTSPFLETPVALSTLKYKSLLNNTNDAWHNRRKSYSFEDESPVNETILHSNETLAMESSTDSGICKSTEIVNDPIEKSYTPRSFINIKTNKEPRESTFKDWLARNRPNETYNGIELKPHQECENVTERLENKIALQSVGKMTISLSDQNKSKYQNNSYESRRAKRVEFCKTELHFAAESGKVNIIATDDKPPPTNDFRKRRSAFVPIGNFDKFDELLTIRGHPTIDTDEISDIGDESTAATKSILKNKIPKPKPYLLGENMDIGNDDVTSNNLWEPKTTAVSLINKQLQSEEKLKTDLKREFTEHKTKEITHKVTRTMNDGLVNKVEYNVKPEIHTKKYTNTKDKEYYMHKEPNDHNTVKHTIKILQSSPILQPKSKSRQLRESDLTYFGITNNNKSVASNDEERYIIKKDVEPNYDILNAVRLVQQASNTVVKDNNKYYKESSSRYQNIPIKLDFTPVSSPREHVQKLDFQEKSISNSVFINGVNKTRENKSDTRRSRFRREDEIINKKSRSLSEPPKQVNGAIFRADTEKRSMQKFKNEINYSEECLPLISINEESRGLNNIENTETPSKTKTEYNDDSVIHNGFKSKSKKQCMPLYENLEMDKNIITKKLTSRKNYKERENAVHKQNKTMPNGSCEKSEFKNNNQQSPSINSLTNKTTIINHKEQSIPTHKKKDQETKIITENRQRQPKHYEKKRNSIESNDDKSKSSMEKEKSKNQVKQIRYESKSNKKNNELDPNYRQRQTTVKKDLNKTTLRKDSKDCDNSQIRHEKRSDSRNRKNINEVDKLDNHSKRREYVLNYDDKNGAFCSISKIKHGSSKSPDRMKTNSSKIQHPIVNRKQRKAIEKSPLLQSPDWHNSQKRFSNEDNKWKSRVHVHRSCQLL